MLRDNIYLFAIWLAHKWSTSSYSFYYFIINLHVFLQDIVLMLTFRNQCLHLIHVLVLTLHVHVLVLALHTLHSLQYLSDIDVPICSFSIMADSSCSCSCTSCISYTSFSHSVLNPKLLFKK